LLHLRGIRLLLGMLLGMLLGLLLQYKHLLLLLSLLGGLLLGGLLQLLLLGSVGRVVGEDLLSPPQRWGSGRLLLGTFLSRLLKYLHLLHHLRSRFGSPSMLRP
jgi:hypothetical protein